MWDRGERKEAQILKAGHVDGTESWNPETEPPLTPDKPWGTGSILRGHPDVVGRETAAIKVCLQDPPADEGRSHGNLRAHTHPRSPLAHL